MGIPLKSFHPNEEITTESIRFTHKRVFVFSKLKPLKFRTKKEARKFISEMSDHLVKNKAIYEKQCPGGYYRLNVVLYTLSIEPGE